jgi:phospholipase C
VPTSTTLAQEYAVFNNWHAAIPGPTMVNRAYIDSATSDGMGWNDPTDIILGYPQHTIFQVW